MTRPAVASWEVYAARWSTLHGGFDPRTASPLVRGWLRLAYHLGRLLARSGASPNAVTVGGLVLSAGVPLLVGRGTGGPIAAAGLVVLSAAADTADGALAVISERVSRLGQVYDSVADRVSEACWLVALALIGAPFWLLVLGGGLAWLHEYLRARATVAGMADIGAVTVAERPTRILVVTFGLVGAGVAGIAGVAGEAGVAAVAAVTAAVWALLGAVAFIQLAVAVRRVLS